jgi:hypothetical protein
MTAFHSDDDGRRHSSALAAMSSPLAETRQQSRMETHNAHNNTHVKEEHNMTPTNRTPHTASGTVNTPRDVDVGATGNPVGESATNSRLHREKLTLYHPNSAGTGAAMQLEPRLNRNDSERYNCFFMEMAAQRSVATRASDRIEPASFDWAKKLTVKLDFADICEILSVLEGRVDKLGGQRNGLFHKSGNATTIISLQKAERGGYFLGLSKKAAGEESAARVGMTLTDAEVVGMRTIFQTGLFFITFHSHLFQASS